MRYSLLISILLICACSEDSKIAPSQKVASNQKVFSALSLSQTKVDFNNKIVETAELNYYRYVYLYNGGGVGLEDINNDGLADIYFTSTMGADKLYLNKGNFEFEDISQSSGISNYEGCKTGVTFIDINLDGFKDIYVCRAGWTDRRENLLFVNNKDNTFTEQAAAYGLNDNSRSIQSTFFDYDKDGDLDMYLATHPEHFNVPIGQMIASVQNPIKKDSDRLYQNQGNGKFKDVSLESGIQNHAYSLGLVSGDLNGDDWPDLYVTSDFQPRDLYYINNQDGTFTEALEDKFPHCSYFSMGVDLVDINNDGHLDIFTGEMLAEDNLRQKTNMAPMNMQRFADMVNNGMHYQYMRNSLQINNGNGHFSDVAHYSGIDKSDWSWSSLFGDYDLDGDDDLLVVNGWLKDTQDKDFNKRSNKLAAKHNNRLTFEQAYGLLNSTPLKNYAFENIEKLKFEKVSDKWGFNHLGFSNGMASGDLDNDGDLDVVVNNINDLASIYRNNTNSDNYIKIKLEGPPANPSGLNTKVTLKTANKTYFREHIITRGFQSSCQDFVHFGVAKGEDLLSIDITWPDNKMQHLEAPELGNLIVSYGDAKGLKAEKSSKNNLLKSADHLSKSLVHKDVYYDDYNDQVLLPHLLSQLGPAVAKADINKDGLEDLFFGGAKNQASTIQVQLKNGRFKKMKVTDFVSDRGHEDTDAIFTDLNGDGFLDLYVVSGSSEFPENSDLLNDRVYINKSGKSFVRNLDILPTINSSGGCVAKTDINGDGVDDLFIGGRVVHKKYPFSPESKILVSEGKTFVDQTMKIAPDINEAGMISDAIWSDFDGDNDKDLILVGEWTDIMFFENQNGVFKKNTKLISRSNVGWWNCIKEFDIDKDGDLDYIVGNLGENYKYKASNEEPFEIFANDLDQNGSSDIVLGCYIDKKLYPIRGFQCSSEQMPSLSNKISSYEEFGLSDVYKIYGDAIKDAVNMKANIFSSVILRNNGGGFSIEKLPWQAQLAPIKDVILKDLNADGYLDVIGAGNWFVAEVETPRADSGTGIVLINNDGKGFSCMSATESGFFANRDVRRLLHLNAPSDKQEKIIVANNNSALQIFELN